MYANSAYPGQKQPSAASDRGVHSGIFRVSQRSIMGPVPNEKYPHFFQF